MNFKSKIASSLVLSLGITSIMAAPISAESIAELQKEQSNMKENIEQKKSELDSNSRQKSEVVNKMKNINDSINVTEKKISTFAGQISEQEEVIDVTNRKIAKT